MSEKFKLDCPHCGAGQKSDAPLSVGEKVRCARCGKSFHVPAPDARPVVLVAKGVAAPPGGIPAAAPTGPQRGPVDPSRLFLVLGGVLLYLAGGAALAVWCFELNGSSGEPAHAEPTEPVRPLDPPPSPSEPAPLPPVRLTPGVDPKRQKAINDAIVKGVWYLKDNAGGNGAWGKDFIDRPDVTVGFGSLPGLTLLECGVHPNDPVVQKAAAIVRSQAVQIDRDQNYAGSSTYQIALAILFLDRLGDKKDEPLIQYLALCLMAGQHPTEGGWTYGCPALDRSMTAQLLKQLADPKQSLDNWRKTAMKGGTFEIGGWDNSNTQFAILGVWAAGRHHVPIDRCITRVEKHFRSTQQDKGPDPAGNNLDLDGCWYYYDSPQSGCPWPSMTCAGLLGLAVAHGATTDPQEKKQKPLADPAIQRGLAMLAREIGRPDEKRPRDHYFLWSVERVGVLYGLEKINGKDWYRWGCDALLPAQGEDGSWQSGAWYGDNPVLNTCFALLFLKRANLASDLTMKLQLLEKAAK